jgi:hypothetical protein
MLAIVVLGWAAFSELFANSPVTISNNGNKNKGVLQESHFYSPPLAVIDNFDCSFLAGVKASVRDAMNRIESDWEVQSYPNFLKMMHIPPTSWSLQKAKFMSILLDQAQAASVGVTNENYGREYVAGFSGSSVTAGHDNYFHEAFPSVFERSLKIVFEKMHMKLVVRNDAIGNNPCFPYDACIATHLGDDLDFLAWEQSMNCGRESRPLDTFTRNALRMKKSPTVLYVLSGGAAWAPEECQNISVSNNDATLEKQRLQSPPTVKMIRDFSSQLDLSNSLDKDSSYRNILSSMEFLRDGTEHLFDAHRFAAAAPMGHSTFPMQDYRCMGPYNANFTLKSPPGMTGANWHPGAMGHKLRGENMAYFFLAILMDAIETMETVAKFDVTSCTSLPKASVPDMGTENQTATRLLSSSSASTSSQDRSNIQAVFPSTIPLSLLITTINFASVSSAPPIEIPKLEARIVRYVHHYHLQKELPGADQSTNSGPTLITINIWTMISAYVQQYLYHHLHHSHVIPSVPSHYHIDETIFAPNCYTNYEPRTLRDHSISSLIVNETFLPPITTTSNSNMSWQLQLSPFDAKAVNKAEQRGLGYLDRKYAFFSQGVYSTLYLHVHVNHHAPLWLCELQKGFLRYPATMTDLDLGAEVTAYVNFFQDNNSPAWKDVDQASKMDPTSDRKGVLRGAHSSRGASPPAAISTVGLAESMGFSGSLMAKNSNKGGYDPALTIPIGLSLLSDQCYRTTVSLPPGEHLLTIRQKGLQQINLAYLLTF